MSGFVVTVEFRLKPGALEGFLALVTENARLSAETEPGCRQFDVVAPANAPLTVFLYEIYDDQAAFDHHKTRPHFLAFDRQSSGLVESRTIVVGRLHFAGRSARADLTQTSR